ncbi:alpha/beta hydrolase [Amaricoccus sp.]|uniref:alpha/beta hydrolase n=1 Tax=Amaricoccus sp. TaxID=1872485 RepID=UPI001B5ABDDC|nr:alpha/beta hydrolase [Amaricoccus sp.]MBP7000805.1 alpha/beta hydrolase [Amaricoccus sp.]
MSEAPYIHAVSPGAPGGTLAFAFHGTGGDERQLVPLVRDLLPEATIVAPRGDVSEGGAARFFRRKAEGVYDMADLARATAKMAAFVEAEIAARKPARMVGLGYSNGANILASLIFARRALLDDAVLMHPLIAWEPDPGPVRTRVLITAGERDPICPPALTRQLAAWLEAQGAPTEVLWHAGGHSVEPVELTEAARFLAAAPAA